MSSSNGQHPEVWQVWVCHACAQGVHEACDPVTDWCECARPSCLEELR